MATNAQKNARHAGALNRIEDVVAVTVTAVANTDFSFQVPSAARNLSFRAKTVTAFGAATDAQLQLGKTAGGAEYVAAVSVKALGDYALAQVATLMAELDTVTGQAGQMTTFTGRVVQSGAASATGLTNLYVSYSLPL